MKKTLLHCFILAIFTNGSAIAADRTAKLEVENMTCPVCPLTIKKALSKVNGVQQVEIDYENKLAEVTFDDARTTTVRLIEATTNAGFPSTVKLP
jgi:mercuric ion binding protein